MFGPARDAYAGPPAKGTGFDTAILDRQRLPEQRPLVQVRLDAHGQREVPRAATEIDVGHGRLTLPPAGAVATRAHEVQSVNGFERANQDRPLHYEDVRQRAIASLGLQVRKVNWFSTYRVHHRIADRYRRGRAFLLGDAAHVHSPAGGQGMNTGIGDAVNLAWKLAAVLRGRAPEALLDSYQVERQAFARRLHFMVHFPDPDEPTRRLLWEHHLAQLPATDPDDPVDVGFLAGALEVAGGDIRNIVLAAAYDAVAQRRAVGMRDLRAATVREMTKLGRRTGDPRWTEVAGG